MALSVQMELTGSCPVSGVRDVCPLLAVTRMSSDWKETLAELQKRLAVCPTDIVTRHALASLLEELRQHGDALSEWNTILSIDPNNLKAREGVVRCIHVLASAR
jgi:cytochrome c-type biogenesis protein CcmH/NrfG